VVELAGIIVRPDYQCHHLGTKLITDFIDEQQPSGLIAYTRNPSLLRAVGRACAKPDVLSCDTEAVSQIPYATLEEDGYGYHVGRYAPGGLYGKSDPADRVYEGRILRERCELLNDKTNALAISVTIQGEIK
jgi:hypothetical protein